MQFRKVRRGQNAGETRVNSPAGAAGVMGPSRQEIAHAAFCHWLGNGGDAEQIWLDCERQLNDRRLISGESGSRPGLAVP